MSDRRNDRSWRSLAFRRLGDHLAARRARLVAREALIDGLLGAGLRPRPGADRRSPGADCWARVSDPAQGQTEGLPVRIVGRGSPTPPRGQTAGFPVRIVGRGSPTPPRGRPKVSRCRTG